MKEDLMNHTVRATVVTVLILVTSLLGGPDSKTDFSGTWEMDMTRSESPYYGESKGPVTVVIKQTADELSVETRRDGLNETIVYKMDGSETEKPATDNGPYKWRARWDGPKLTTEVHRNINRATVTISELLSLADDGKEMMINRTLTVQHGYNVRGAKNYASAKDVFVKAP
jgi:hypothetical protein